MEYTIIPYREDFHKQVMELHVLCMKEAGAYFGKGPWDDDLEMIEEHYLRNRGAFVLVLDKLKLIGMGAFRTIDGDTAEIKRMRVTPALQGRGIGKLILNKLLVRAGELGYKRVILETSDRQERAISLYLNRGFKVYKDEIINGASCRWYELYL